MSDRSLNACNSHDFHFLLDHKQIISFGELALISNCEEERIIEGEARVEKTIQSGILPAASNHDSQTSFRAPS